MTPGWQIPAPAPPLPEPSLLNPAVTEQVLVTVAVIAVVVVVFLLVRPLFQALARRLEGRASSPALQGEVEQLREQVSEVPLLRERLHELEERMEFTERLLAQRRDQELLPKEPPR